MQNWFVSKKTDYNGKNFVKINYSSGTKTERVKTHRMWNNRFHKFLSHLRFVANVKNVWLTLRIYFDTHIYNNNF